MPRTPSPLPSALRGAAFRPRDWDVSARRVRASDLWTPTRGSRLPAGAVAVGDRCVAFSLVLPDTAVFSHSTAAALLGLPLPPHIGDTLHAIVPPETRAPRRRGFAGHQQQLDRRDIRHIGSLRVTSPARAFCDLADMLELPELVAVGDAVARRTSLSHVREVAQRHPLARRKRQQALELLDARAESPKESELRVVLLAAGFGPFIANFVVRDEGGSFVARVDLALPGLRIALEYEGDHHRDRRQWRRDMTRRRRLEALDWIYLPVTQADLTDPIVLFDDLRAAMTRRSGAVRHLQPEWGEQSDKT